jgi:hypothetical protein
MCNTRRMQDAVAQATFWLRPSAPCEQSAKPGALPAAVLLHRVAAARGSVGALCVGHRWYPRRLSGTTTFERRRSLAALRLLDAWLTANASELAQPASVMIKSCGRDSMRKALHNLAAVSCTAICVHHMVYQGTALMHVATIYLEHSKFEHGHVPILCAKPVMHKILGMPCEPRVLLGLWLLSLHHELGRPLGPPQASSCLPLPLLQRLHVPPQCIEARILDASTR